MKKWLIWALIPLCLVGMTACREQEDSSVKKPATSSSSSSMGAIELPEDIFD